MRIISGIFKGKKISLPKDNFTRTLRDLVKESIFNLIEHSNKFRCTITNSSVLDIFSGTGSFGIECISRDAKNVIFVENYKEAIFVLKKNISTLKPKKNYKIIEKNCFDIFNTNKEFTDKFDIIFLDPPYKEKKINIIIEYIKDNGILNQDGIMIIHRHKKDNTAITKKLKILEERVYGISKIYIGN